MSYDREMSPNAQWEFFFDCSHGEIRFWVINSFIQLCLTGSAKDGKWNKNRNKMKKSMFLPKIVDFKGFSKAGKWGEKMNFARYTELGYKIKICFHMLALHH